MAYSLEEEGRLPLIHGFAEKPEGSGRVTRWASSPSSPTPEGRIFAGRDSMGTRPLYADEGRTCVASDHRFFARAPVLLPRGACLDIGSGEESVSPAAFTGPSRPSDRGGRGPPQQAAGGIGRTPGEGTEEGGRLILGGAGQLDSSPLLAARHTEVVLCSAYTTGSRDEATTLRAAGMLGLEHKAAVVGSADGRERSARLTSRSRPGRWTGRSGALYSTTSRMAAENGAGLILLGQLADELFGGYMKYSLQAKENEASAVQMMEQDVAAAADRAFVRDELACARFVEARFPFADQGVAGFARSLPLTYKIRGGERKAVLRMAATNLGLPEELVRAPKKAAQYSTGLSKLFS